MAAARAQWQAVAAASADGEIGNKPGGSGMAFSFSAGAVDPTYAAAVTQLGTQIAEVTAQRAEEARVAQTFFGAPFWKSPIVSFLGSLLGAGGKEGGSDHSDSEPRNWR